MSFLPLYDSKVQSLTNYSSVSMVKLLEFLNSLNPYQTISYGRLVRCAIALGYAQRSGTYERSKPIRVGEVYRFYILLIRKQLTPRMSYQDLVDECRLLNPSETDITGYWQLSVNFGGYSKPQFDTALSNFYRLIQQKDRHFNVKRVILDSQ